MVDLESPAELEGCFRFPDSPASDITVSDDYDENTYGLAELEGDSYFRDPSESDDTYPCDCTLAHRDLYNPF